MGKGKIVFLFVLLALCGCQSSKEKSGLDKMVRINLGAEPHSLDPRYARDPNSQILVGMFFDGLTRIGPNDQPELALASSVEISEDLKTYTFTLRDALWTNGDMVRAQDFAYAWKRMLSPDFSCDNAFQLYLIKNGMQVKEGSLSLDELGILTPDSKTLILELEYPIPYVFELLATPYFFPIHQETDEKKPNWSEKQETYVSNGPFLFKQWRHHDQIVVGKNSNYWDADQVQIDGLTLTMVDGDTEAKLFEKKQLDWTGSPLSTIPVDSIAHLRDKIHVKPRDETAFLRTNIEVAPLNHPKMRKALALAINRKMIVEHVTQGGQLPAQRLVPPSMQLQEKPYFSDGAIQEAKRLFKEALEELEMDFPNIKITYINAERSHLIAQAIQQQWFEAFGIRIGLEAIERKVYFDRISKQNFDLAFCSWGADFHDPVNFLEVFKYKSQSTNNTHWEDPEYVNTLNESFRLVNPEKRLEVLAKCEKILMEAMPIIPIFHYTMLYMKDEKLDGVFLSSMGNLDFKWSRLKNDD
ncbi:MAG: Oligopeptide-binding protein OppA [Chlamydiae bacterium]|nr:Oligopeptide-binding protein OppA [Chlamydiota bacterium]